MNNKRLYSHESRVNCTTFSPSSSPPHRHHHTGIGHIASQKQDNFAYIIVSSRECFLVRFHGFFFNFYFFYYNQLQKHTIN